MANFKAVRSHRRRQRSLCLLADMGAELALHDGIEKSAHFVFLATDLKFNPAIGQVADPAGELETFGDVPYRPTKADALHIALVENLDRHHRQIAAEKIDHGLDGFNTDRKMAHPKTLNRNDEARMTKRKCRPQHASAFVLAYSSCRMAIDLESESVPG